jgi:hypothetical protein
VNSVGAVGARCAAHVSIRHLTPRAWCNPLMIRTRVLFEGSDRKGIYGFPAMPEKGQQFRSHNGQVHVVKDVLWTEDLRSGLRAEEPIPVVLEVVLGEVQAPVEPWVM